MSTLNDDGLRLLEKAEATDDPDIKRICLDAAEKYFDQHPSLEELKIRLEIQRSEIANMNKNHSKHENTYSREVIDDHEYSKIIPWHGSLRNDDFLIESEGIQELEQKRILSNLERYGICQIRHLQADYQLGIRPISDELRVEIKKANEGTE